MRNELSEIDKLIRAAKGAEARPRLEEICSREIPRAELADVARLAWRASLAGLGARILNPIVRPIDRQSDASALEIAEYATCLSILGADVEAAALLGTLDERDVPEIHFLRAVAHLRRWEYAEALPLLVKHLERDLTPYQRTVAQVNLAAAYVYERKFARASLLLHRLIYETGVQRLDLLHGNCLELAAYNCLQRGKLDDASRFLGEAERLLATTGSRESLYVRKWQCVIALVRSPDDASLAKLRAVRDEATSRGNWEAVRDCDRFAAVAMRDTQLLEHVYFGTPYPSFRARLLEDFSDAPAMPESGVWTFGAGGGEIDARDGSGGSGESLKPDQLAHRLLATLVSDRYRAFRTPTLFGALFPDEFYNPVSSPTRVYQAVRLLRAWFEAGGIPLEILSADEGFRLGATGPCRVRVGIADAGIVVRLRASLPTQFTLQEIMDSLALSRRSAFRLLGRGKDEGWLEKVPRARPARYRVR